VSWRWEEWPERLAAAVDASGYTRTEIAARAGIARQTLSRVLKRQMHPSLEVVTAIAYAAGVTVGSILGEPQPIRLSDKEATALRAFVERYDPIKLEYLVQVLERIKISDH
jgi:transcriptional regulator with XRE-family HTH domain